MALLRLLFDAVVLGIGVRTPGIAALWVDAKLSEMAEEAVTDLTPVLHAIGLDLAAIDLCLLKHTSKHVSVIGRDSSDPQMQQPIPSPSPATIRHLAMLQGTCRGPTCRTPLIGPPGRLFKSTRWNTTITLQPVEAHPPIADGFPAVPGLQGIYALAQYDYSPEVATALARHVQLVHAAEIRPWWFQRTAARGHASFVGTLDDAHPAPEFRDLSSSTETQICVSFCNVRL
jgi:hypothetical protein